MSLAIDQGSDDVGLINDTIDNVLRETVDRFPERDALVAPHQGIRQNWTEFAETVDDVAKGLMGLGVCLLYTSPSPRDQRGSRMPSSA